MPISHMQLIPHMQLISNVQAITSSSAWPKHKHLPSSEEDSDSSVSPAGCTTSDAISIDDNDNEVLNENYSSDNNTDGGHQRKPVLPANFFIVDLAAVFTACDKACESGSSVCVKFTSLFGLCFWCTTYYDNQKWWYDAPQQLCDKAIAAGHTP